MLWLSLHDIAHNSPMNHEIESNYFCFCCGTEF